ncbi:MAG: histidine triad nucleotide-binding protein [Gammaproteobacteria bacterium]|nr:histidine triad nucleotide-binding protein [Gammaproteobacteria bacterium]
MMDCLFCRIINGSIPAKLIHRDEIVVAFDDINPQAPQHKLIVPTKHIASLNELSTEDSHILGHMAKTAAQLAKDLNIADQGYRLVMNCGNEGGQTVAHIHAHLIGGRQMHWPPG